MLAQRCLNALQELSGVRAAHTVGGSTTVRL